MTDETTLESPRLDDKPILISGMFDMCNFGDLLFPLVAAYRLKRYGFNIVAVSPTGRSTGLADAMPSIAVDEVLTGGIQARGFLLGGGYIIHNHRMQFLAEYREADLGEWVGPGMWLGITLAAALRDVPVAWNGPGVPHPFARSHRVVVDASLHAADYVSLRDRGSRELLEPPDDVSVAIVPDPIADLASLWAARQLSVSFEEFLARKSAPREVRLAAFHVRNRSLAGIGVAGIAAALDAFAQDEGVCPVLLAVGRSHEDEVTARAVSACMRARHLVLDDPLSLAEIAAVICNSVVYAGASLHGYVAAAAYHVPGVLVALPAYRKFAGFLEHTQRLQDLARGWPEALQLASARVRGGPVEGIPPSVTIALDRHWDSIAQALSDRGHRRQERSDFLRACVQVGISAIGPRWAHQPLMRRSSGSRPEPIRSHFR